MDDFGLVKLASAAARRSIPAPARCVSCVRSTPAQICRKKIVLQFSLQVLFQRVFYFVFYYGFTKDDWFNCSNCGDSRLGKKLNWKEHLLTIDF